MPEATKTKKMEQRTMTKITNIMTDRIIWKNVSIPKSIHIRNTPMAVYIDKTYIPTQHKKINTISLWSPRHNKIPKRQIPMDRTTFRQYRTVNACYIHTKQTYSRKKTTIKYINRWLPSGSKSFVQNLGCTYCEGDGKKHDHAHFLTCEYGIDRKVSRMKAITDKWNVLLTAKDICDGIHRGITNYYNTTM